MALSLPPTLLLAAQRGLPPDVLATVSADPTGQLPGALWAQLSDEQRRMVRTVRSQLRDGFEARTAPSPEVTEPRGQVHLVGADPLGSAPATPNDPEAMHVLFGAVVDTTGLEAFEGEALLAELRRRFFGRHVTLDYHDARVALFTRVDAAHGVVRDVYAGRVLDGVNGIPDAEGTQRFNTEHTWPQSQLKAAGKDAAVSDLHHLFPVDTTANGKRANLPFGEVVTEHWRGGESRLGLDAHGTLVFEPPPGHRGDVARAMFWIADAYELDIPPDEEAVLRRWAAADQVDEPERARNQRVAEVQGDLNPFVVQPELSARVEDF
ncbi:MAG: endonuclease [Myxococcaceae bacterium]|nr:endonuclease [Myxococcaceae bacterium]